MLQNDYVRLLQDADFTKTMERVWLLRPASSLGGESTFQCGRICPYVDVFAAVAFIMEWISANGLVVVIVGALAGVATFGVVVGDIVVVSRQPPNHPYFTHDVVGKSDVDVDELVEVEVVVSSRHPAKVSSNLKAGHGDSHTPPSRRLASRSPCRSCCS